MMHVCSSSSSKQLYWSFAEILVLIFRTSFRLCPCCTAGFRGFWGEGGGGRGVISKLCSPKLVWYLNFKRHKTQALLLDLVNCWCTRYDIKCVDAMFVEFILRILISFYDQIFITMPWLTCKYTFLLQVQGRPVTFLTSRSICLHSTYDLQLFVCVLCLSIYCYQCPGYIDNACIFYSVFRVVKWPWNDPAN